MADRNKYPDNPVDRFDDVFHGQNDDADQLMDDNVDFDDYYVNFALDPWEEEDTQLERVIIEEIKANVDLPTTEEQHLSQKLSQLSATGKQESTTTSKKRPAGTPTTPVAPVTTKKNKTGTGLDTDDDLPSFLLGTSPDFEQTMAPLLQKSASNMNINYLRKIAHIKFKLVLNDLNIQLWNTYLESGTGKLQPLSGDRHSELCLWPKAIKRHMNQNRPSTTTTTTTVANESEDVIHLNYVSKMLRQFRDQNTLFNRQLTELKQRLKNSFTLEMEEAIDRFVAQHGTAFQSIPIEGQIAIVKFDYKDRLIERDFERQGPINFQTQLFQKLSKEKTDAEISKMEVTILKQRLVHNLLPNCFDSLSIPEPTNLSTIANNDLRQHLSERYHKVLERTKSDMMCVYISSAETKAEEDRIAFDKDMASMNAMLRSGPENRHLTRTMVDLLRQRFKNTEERLVSDGQELNLSRRSDLSQSIIGCAPSLYQYVTHSLSPEELAFLNRGPGYASPGQLHFATSSTLTLDQILQKQIAPLRREITNVLTTYPVDLSRRMHFEKNVQQLFHTCFSNATPSPSFLVSRALYEKQLIGSIRHKIRREQLILRRTADDCNTFYLGRQDQFRQQVNNYFEESLSYEIIGLVSGSSTLQQHVNTVSKSIDSALAVLQEKKLITREHLFKLSVGRKKNLRLPYAYFLPDIHEDSTMSPQLRLSSCDHSPTQVLSVYLHDLLRPLFDSLSRSTTFANTSEFIQRLQNHLAQPNGLRPSTCLVTFEFTHLYTHLEHADILQAVNRFLSNPILGQRYDKLSKDAIEELTSIFLESNAFYHEEVVYRYTKGSPLNYPLTRLLCNIYLHDWQTRLLREVRTVDEIYGRHHHRGFFTWNGDMKTIETYFKEANDLLAPPIRAIVTSGRQVLFLNTVIQIRNGSLYTRVHHDPTQQPFLLPYATAHPRLAHRQWFRFALFRAGAVCTKVEDFHEERVYLEASFLTNGYSLDFVEQHVREFYRMVSSVITRVTLDQTEYDRFRYNLFESIDRNIQIINMRDQFLKNEQRITMYYLFDWGSRSKFNREFYRLWSSILEADPTFKKYGLSVKIHSKQCCSSNILLAN